MATEHYNIIQREEKVCFELLFGRGILQVTVPL